MILFTAAYNTRLAGTYARVDIECFRRSASSVRGILIILEIEWARLHYS